MLSCQRTSQWRVEQDRASLKLVESSCASLLLSLAGCSASLESSWCPSWRPWLSCWRKTTPTWASLQKHTAFHIFTYSVVLHQHFHFFLTFLTSPAGWGPGDSYHGSSMSVQHAEPAGRPGSSSGSPASRPSSTQPQEQRRAQELHPPHPRVIGQWGEEANIDIVDFFNFQDSLHLISGREGLRKDGDMHYGNCRTQYFWSLTHTTD